MRVKVLGVDEWNRKYRRIQDSYSGSINGDPFRRAVHDALGRVQSETKKRLTGGHPLWVRTGRLRASILINTKRLGKKVRGEAGTDVFYGKIHELYGVGKKKKRRPFLGPSFKAQKRNVQNDIKDAWKRINNGKRY